MTKFGILVCFFLESAGYLVLPAVNGQAALQIAAAFGGPIDPLLTDLDMPGGGGVELAKALLKVYPRIKILLMSASYEAATIQIFVEAVSPFS